MGKHSKSKQKHKATIIERLLPIERIIELFYQSFDQPYLNPSAELTLQEFTAAFPETSKEAVEAALSYWTNHSGKKVLQTKLVSIDGKDTPVWFIHGLEAVILALGGEAPGPLAGKQ